MAVMHWKVHVDANDVEFVLCSAPDRLPNPEQISPDGLTADVVPKMKENTSTWATHQDNFKKRVTHIWMLDFNCCKDFLPTASGIEQLVHSFFRNDPYFPRPLAKSAKNQHLWKVFRDR